MKVIVSAGGTGGHIYPALSIIAKIKEKEPSSEILYIGTTDRMEHTIIPEKKIPYFAIEMKGLNRKNIFKNISVLKNYCHNVKILKQEIKKFNPDIVVGVGGYVTAPVIYSAKKLGYKTFIHEQNSIPGLSNKFLMHYVDKVGVSLPDSIQYFPKEKTILTGNPRSEEVFYAKEVSKKELGLSLTEHKKLIVIVMGSLGSTTMNKKLKDTLPLFATKEYEVVFITGKNYCDEYKKIKTSTNVKIVPYLDNMAQVLKKTDIIVSRAGASSIAEITALGIPSILIPSPYVTHNHQLKNAQALKKQRAAFILEEKDYDGEKLVAMIESLLTNKQEYDILKNNAQKLGITNSATKIYQEIKNLIDGEQT
ncbi:MAG: undecaprenyldiphospho-muramoylpentapeptide beta-N-acetylglucosaminyltransferase [bacterium]|nr:undecaprenyldiphospho-muramoylpentapeptide beta-N-acetylglucosaminyltransferase [bacterium]